MQYKWFSWLLKLAVLPGKVLFSLLTPQINKDTTEEIGRSLENQLWFLPRKCNLLVFWKTLIARRLLALSIVFLVKKNLTGGSTTLLRKGSSKCASRVDPTCLSNIRFIKIRFCFSISHQIIYYLLFIEQYHQLSLKKKREKRNTRLGLISFRFKTLN